TIAHVMAWIVVEINQKQTWMMTAGSDDQFMQVFKVLAITAQDGDRLADRPDQDSRIRSRQQARILGQEGIVPESPETRGEAWPARILVNQKPHCWAGPSRRPRTRSLSTSCRRSCQMSS